MVKISDQKLANELRRCERENGYVETSILNDSSNDFPTQPTYQNRFGSLSEACKKFDVQQKRRTKKWTKDEVIDEAKKHFQENGDLKVSDFADASSELPSTNTLYNHFDSISDLIEELGVEEEVAENRKNDKMAAIEKVTKYTEESEDELIEHLWWVKKEYGDTKTSSIEEAPGPSSQTYITRFGSINDARDEAGISESYNESFEKRIGDLPDSYDNNADGYVYTIKLLDDSTEYLYVGETTCLEKRLNRHASGESKILFHQNGEYNSLREHGLVPVSVIRIDNFYKSDRESEKEFKDRLQSNEHIISYQVAVGLNNPRVLGGR
jgi:hypothetical protein